MLRNLRNQIIVAGFFLCGLWGFVTAMSKGLPKIWCDLLNTATGGILSSQIMSMQHGFYYQVDNNNMPTTIFMILFFIAFVITMYLALRIERAEFDKKALGWILGFAVVFRVILLPGEPIHENDFYRYLWDGKSIVHGINPFKYAPSDLFMYEYHYTEDYYDDISGQVLKARDVSDADARRLDKLLQLRDENRLFYDRIGHWQVPTIYPPTAQAVFALTSLLNEDSYVFMKFMFMLFDLGVVVLIVLLLKRLNRNPMMVLIYAWSPLVLKEFPNSGHYDPIAIFFTLLAVYWVVFDKHFRGYVALALATLSKFFSIVLLPIFLPLTGWRRVPVVFAVIAFAYLPFLLWGDTRFSEIFQGLSTYNKEWSYNSSIFAIVYRLMESINPEWVQTLIPPKVVVALAYMMMVLAMSVPKQKGAADTLHRCFWAITGLFIINPVGDPWYYCWCIPFLCLFPYRSWLLLSGTLILSYLNFQTLYPLVEWIWWGIPALSYVIYVPFFVLLAYELWTQPQYLQKE